MRLGSQQLRLLIMTASPTCILLTPDKTSQSLVERGLLASDDVGGCTITPAGLRALADEMEAGRIPAALDAMRRDAAAQRKRAGERQANRTRKARAPLSDKPPSGLPATSNKSSDEVSA